MGEYTCDLWHNNMFRSALLTSKTIKTQCKLSPLCPRRMQQSNRCFGSVGWPLRLITAPVVLAEMTIRWKRQNTIAVNNNGVTEPRGLLDSKKRRVIARGDDADVFGLLDGLSGWCIGRNVTISGCRHGSIAFLCVLVSVENTFYTHSTCVNGITTT